MPSVLLTVNHLISSGIIAPSSQEFDTALRRLITHPRDWEDENSGGIFVDLVAAIRNDDSPFLHRFEASKTLAQDWRYGHLETARWLVKMGADPERVDSNGYFLLHVACANRVSDAIHWLVSEEKANLHARTHDARTPLMIACEKGRHEIVEFLLQHGSDVTRKCDTGETAFAMACRHGHRKVMRSIAQNVEPPSCIIRLVNDYVGQESILHAATRAQRV